MDNNNRTVAIMLDALIYARRKRAIEQGETGATEAPPEKFLTDEEHTVWMEVKVHLGNERGTNWEV